MEEKIRHYLAENSGHGPDVEIGPDLQLFEHGILDSIEHMRFIGFLEEQFGILIEHSDLRVENFDTLSHIVGFVRRKQEER